MELGKHAYLSGKIWKGRETEIPSKCTGKVKDVSLNSFRRHTSYVYIFSEKKNVTIQEDSLLAVKMYINMEICFHWKEILKSHWNQLY